MGFQFHLKPSRNTSAPPSIKMPRSTHCWQVLRVVGKRPVEAQLTPTCSGDRRQSYLRPHTFVRTQSDSPDIAQHNRYYRSNSRGGFPKKKRHPAARLAREHMMPISCGVVDQVEKGGAPGSRRKTRFTRTASGPRANKADTPSSCGSLPLTVDDATMPPWVFGSAITHAGPSDESH